MRVLPRLTVMFLLVSASTALPACGDDASPAAAEAYDGPDTITIASSEARVTFTLRPFGMRVARPDGRTVLAAFDGDRSVDGDAAGAYGALGATHRETELATPLIEGYDHARATDEPWLHGAETLSAQVEGRRAFIRLADPREPDVVIGLTAEVAGPEIAIDARVIHDRKDAARRLNLMGQSFLAAAGERFVGLGEREDAIDRRGRRYRCWVEEGGLGGGENASPGPSNPAPNGPDMTHVPIPFYMSSAGYGLWIDTGRRTAFTFGADDPSLLRFEAEDARLSYVIFVDDDPKHLLGDFAGHVGHARLQAPWAYGPRRRVDMDAVVDGIPEERALRERGVPTTVIDDTTHFLPNGSGYGDPAGHKAWTDRLHALGYKATAYFNGHVSATRPEAAALLADGRANDAFVRLDDGTEFRTLMNSGGWQQVVTLDLTKPSAIAWFETRMGEALSMGYDGWMLDFGEYLPQRAVLANGMTGWEAHNLYPLFLQRATYDYLRRVRGDDFLFYARSGYTGTQATAPVTWSGDPSASFDDARGLPAQVRAALNAGLSGIPFWGSDISGFTCLNDPPADKEVYLRWAAFGALSVDMHDENACAGAKDGAKKWTLWSDAETTAAYGGFARLHTRLFPYLYAAADEAARTGIPVMRHPLLMHPESPDAWDAVDEYWFGPSLYAAPVVRRGATSRELRLPPGRWFDWWTLASADGGRRTVCDAPLDVIPLYLRAGGIVPMLAPDVETLATTDDPAVVDMTDRDGVLDVRAALDPDAPAAAIRLVDGTALIAALAEGPIALPADVPAAAGDAELASCDRCGRIDVLPGGARRVRITASGVTAAGALSLGSSRPDKPLRVRWDILIG